MLHRRARGLWAVLAVAAVTLAFQLPFFDRWYSAMDEGHMLKFADIVARGGELYRDATVYPLPGAFYMLAWVFELFEPSILLSRWIVVLEFSVFVALVFALLRRIVSPLYALYGVGFMLMYRVWTFPHWQIYNYSTTALLIFLASLLALLAFFESRRKRMLAFSGLLYGIGVWCKQDYGAAVLLAVGLVLAVYSRTDREEGRQPLWRLLAVFLAPAAAVGIATGLHFLRQGMLGEVVQLTALNHFVGMSKYEYSSFPDLLPLFVQDPALRDEIGGATFMPGLIFTVDLQGFRSSWLYRETAVYDTLLKAFIYGPWLLMAFGGVSLWRRKASLDSLRTRQPYLAELALFGLAFSLLTLAHMNKPQDYLHLAVLYWPLLCLVLVSMHRMLRGRTALAWATAAVLALPMAALVGYSGFLLWQLRAMHGQAVPLERAGTYVMPEEAKLLEDLVDYVKANTAPDEAVAIMPYFPLVQFLADRDGPHRSSYIVWPFPEFPDRDSRIIAAMDATRTPLVIYNHTQFLTFPPVSEYAPELFAYLVDNYETDRVFTYDAWGRKLSGLKRSSGEPRGVPLLADGTASASVEIEQRGGPPRPLPPGERGEYARMALWPFRPVLALRPTVDGGRSVVAVAADVPEDATLVTAVGVHPELWFRLPPSWVRFELAIRADGVREVLFERTLKPTTRFEDRGWFDVEIPLDRFAGRSVVFELSTVCERPEGELLEMGGWGAPRLVTGPDLATIGPP